MSLTKDDLAQIRLTVREEVGSVIGQKLRPLEDKIDTLENDVKENYFMISRLDKQSITDKSFKKLSLENKLLKLNSELLAAAKEAGITLPR